MLEKNAVEMYSTYNEGKSVFALKSELYRYVTSTSNKYNNTYHKTRKVGL